MAFLPGVEDGNSKLDEFAPKSSFLGTVKYDRKGNTLDITFKSGSKRRYFSVSPATFDAFRESPNHSSFYARAFKGSFASSPIIEHTIGREKSQPLKKFTQRKTLDAGLKRTSGTVARAGL